MSDAEERAKRELAHLACATIHKDDFEDGAAYMECIGHIMKESKKQADTFSYCMKCGLNFWGKVPHCPKCGSKTQVYKTSAFGDGVTTSEYGVLAFRPFNRTLIKEGEKITGVIKTDELKKRNTKIAKDVVKGVMSDLKKKRR